MAYPVVLCIGSSGVSGDSLGPLVGDLLRDKYNVPAFVYGGTSKPVNGVNYGEYVDHIKTKHKGSVVIAVDACVGDAHDVGKIKYTFNGVSAGGALNKKLTRIGDLGVLGVVAERQRDNLSALMAVPFRTVEAMSEGIASKVARLINGWQLAAGEIIQNTQHCHAIVLQEASDIWYNKKNFINKV